jgi:lipopolysaccharide transport system permease protein
MHTSIVDDDQQVVWDCEISGEDPNTGIRFREVWQYRDLLYLLVKRDITAFYKQTLLGPLWFLIQPTLTSAIFVLIFGKIANLSTDEIPQFVFYLCGITFWSYFADCVTKTASVFRENADLFSKVYFPRVLLPLSTVIANLARFGIQFALFLFILTPYWMSGQIQPNLAILLLPLVVVCLATLGLAVGMICSSLTAKYRDLIFLLQFGVQLVMYVTPIAYPVSAVPERYRTFLWLNPLTSLVEATRYGFLGAGTLSGGTLVGAVVTTIVSFLLAIKLFSKIERTVVDTV